MKAEISRVLLEQIMALAAAEPGEVCGLLLGQGARIDAILPAANVAPDPARHFELAPAALLDAHRATRRGGPAVLGHRAFRFHRKRTAPAQRRTAPCG